MGGVFVHVFLLGNGVGGFVILRLGGCDFCDDRILECGLCHKADFHEVGLGDHHGALLVKLPLERDGADADAVVGACLDEFHGVVGCAGLGELGGEQQSLVGLDKFGDDATQLRHVVPLQQLGGLAVDVERAALERDTLTARDGGGGVPRDCHPGDAARRLFAFGSVKGDG